MTLAHGYDTSLGAFSTQAFVRTEISNQTRYQGNALWLRHDANTVYKRCSYHGAYIICDVGG